ncbi:MAG: ribonuclease J, partial [Proteobacteria bacterium]|nr:ribonuclease J [Pseudomonadota bacterium]
KVLILGAGLESSMKVASDVGIYNAHPGLLIEPAAASSIDRTRLVVILTGSQGESRSALMRIALGEHKQFSMKPGDLCIFSSRTIPGNERVIQSMMSLLERKGAEIYSIRNNKDIHVSGHGYRDDLKAMISAIRPKTFIPVHGTFSHMQSNSKIPGELGLSKTKCIVVENGDVIDLTKNGVALSDRLSVKHRFVDGESYISLQYETMRERLRIGELGLVVVTLAFDKGSRKVLDKVRVTIQGLGVREGETIRDLEDKCARAAEKGFERSFSAGETTPEGLAEQVRMEVRRTLFSIYRKKPVVVAHLHAL